jgi:O-methyltransferase
MERATGTQLTSPPLVTRLESVHDRRDSPLQTPAELYLDLMNKCLTRSIFPDEYPENLGWLGSVVRVPIKSALARFQVKMIRRAPFRASARSVGKDWPAEADTMIGLARLDNIQFCVTDVLRRRVPGDLIETGVWRGGATIFMRAVLAAYGERQRSVWVADSFAGLPKPCAELYPADTGNWGHQLHELAIPIESVRANFAKYGLLDEQVRFLKGWFKDTLPGAPIDRLAVARLDGDLYESTMDALEALYPRLSVGGYLIVDDYLNIVACRRAVDDYRRKFNINEEIQAVDWTAVYWRRER